MDRVTRTNFRVLEVRKDLVRSEKLDGRDYTVAPCIGLVEGVHNGELVTFEEIAVFPDSWNGRPLPIDHPKDAEGQPVTANSPKVIESSSVGFLFNVVRREDLRGISGEIWVDNEKAMTVPGGEEVLRKLNAGEPLEVSTAYYTFVENIPGEWKNPNGTIEKYTSSQNSLRPDHLALLPFDTGACSWEDGCGTSRINVQEKSDDHTPESLPEVNKVADLKVNGKQLGKTLTGAIAVHADSEGGTDAMVTRLAAACGVETTKMQSLIAGELDFVPRTWLAILSVILDIDSWDIFMAASNDNSDARHNEQVKENLSQSVAIPDNKDQKVENAACGCDKSLRTKVQELVSNALKSIGIKTNDAAPAEQEKQMDKKTKIEALIASDKTQFTADHRTWLETLSDDQLAVLEPKVDAKVEPKANEPVVANAAAPVEVKPEVKAAVPTRAQILEALGASEEDFAILTETNKQKKTARANKIAAITAIKECPYDKAELENFSDALLDKTLTLLEPAGTPFRTAAGPQRQNANEIPPTPAILLASGQEGK